MNDEYIPRAGDLVIFPEAPMERNRNRGYIITDARISTVMSVTGGSVWFHAEGEEHVYFKSLHALREIGMTLVMSVDKLDPTMGAP